MGTLALRRTALSIFLIVVIATGIFATAQEDKKPAPISASARLAAAKTIFVKNAGGSDIPFNVISEGVLGWGHFVTVESAEKADIVLEVTSPEDSKASSISKTGVSASTGQPENSVTTSKEISSGPVKLAAYDGRTHVPLWSASERTKYAMKQKSWDDNLVDAAQKLFAQFHDCIEPDTAK